MPGEYTPYIGPLVPLTDEERKDLVRNRLAQLDGVQHKHDVVLSDAPVDAGPLARLQLVEMHRLLAPVLEAAAFSPTHEKASDAIARLLAQWRSGLSPRVPPAQPADLTTPSAAIDRCTCGHTKALHVGPDHEGECVHEDDGHLFCMCATFTPKAASVTPSVTVEEVADCIMRHGEVMDAGQLRHCAEQVLALLSLPRAPAKETSAADFAWIIETAGPVYWTGQLTGCHKWSPRSHDAVRFSRQCDAESVIAWVLTTTSPKPKAIEHGWDTERTSPRSAVEAEVVERCAKLADERARHLEATSKMLDKAGKLEHWNRICEAAEHLRALARAQEGREA